MGAKFTLTFPNLYMGWWVELFIFNDFNLFRGDIHFYAGFIDNIVLIWSGKDRFDEFCVHLLITLT